MQSALIVGGALEANVGHTGQRVYTLELIPPTGSVRLSLAAGHAVFADGKAEMSARHGTTFSLRGISPGKESILLHAEAVQREFPVRVVKALAISRREAGNPLLRAGQAVGLLQFRLPEPPPPGAKLQATVRLEGKTVFTAQGLKPESLPAPAGAVRVLLDLEKVRLGPSHVTGDLVIELTCGDAIFGRFEPAISNIVHREGVVPELPSRGGEPQPSSGMGAPLHSQVREPSGHSVPVTVPVPMIGEPPDDPRDEDGPVIYGEELEGPPAIPPFLGTCPSPAVVEDGESGTSEQSFTAGDPVYVHNGEFVRGEQDYFLRSRGPDLRLVRTYRSRVAGQSCLGYGWSLNWDKSLVDLPGAGFALKNGFGRTDTYGSGGAAQTPGMYSTLQGAGGGTREIVHGNGTRVTFGARGQLARIADRTGTGLAFGYDARGRLVSVRDGSGRELKLSYDAEGLLVRVRDRQQREILYHYYAAGESGGSRHDLKAVTATARTEPRYPLGETTIYTYAFDEADAARRHQLVSVTQAAAVADLGIDPAMPFDSTMLAKIRHRASVLNGYDAQGRVVKQRYHDGTFLLDYHPGGRQTTVTDRARDAATGQPLHATFHYDGNLPLRVEQDSSLGPAVFKLEHNDAGFPEATAFVLPSGRRAVFSYDRTNSDPARRGDLLAMEWQGASGSGRIRSTQQLDRFGQPVRVVDPRGHEPGADAARWTTQIEYDAAGQPSRVIFPALSNYGPDGQPAGTLPAPRQQSKFNEYGQPLRQVHASGTVTEFEYGAPGSPAAGLVLTQRRISADGAQQLVTRFDHDALGRPVRVTQPDGRVSTARYDIHNRVVETVDPTGARRRFHYTTQNRLERSELENLQPDGQGGWTPAQPAWFTEQRRYDDFGRLREHTRGSSDPSGARATIAYRYDEADRVVSHVSQGGSVTRYEWGPRNLVLRTVVAAGTPDESAHSVQYGLDGEVLKLTDAGGHAVEHVYDGLGRLVTLRDPPQASGAPGAATHLEYDAASQPTRIYRVEAGGAMVKDIRRTYDERGRVAVEFDALTLRRAVRRYDAVGRHVATQVYDVHGPAPVLLHGSRCAFDADRFGQLAWTEDAEGNRCEFGYDAFLRLVHLRRVGAGGALVLRTLFEYDAKGRVGAVTQSSDDGSQQARCILLADSRNLPVGAIDMNGGAMRNHFNALGQLEVVEHQLDPATARRETYRYDDEGYLQAATDAAGRSTFFEYNRRGDRTRTVAENGAGAHVIHVTQYDARGLPVRLTDARGNVVENRFDELGRIVRRDIRLAPGVGGTSFETFRYDAMSRLVEAANDHTTLTCQHDAHGFVTTEVQRYQGATAAAGGQIRRAFDAAGRLERLDYPQGRSVSFSHDRLGRPCRIEEGGRLLADLSWVAPTLVGARRHGNGTEVAFGYDGLGRMAEVRCTGPGGAALPSFTYRFDAFGNVLAETGSDGLEDRFDYDVLHNLRSAELGRRPAAGTPGRSIEYEYDPAGNRIRRQEGTQAVLYAINGLNQCTAVGPAGQQRPCRWDADMQMAELGDRRFSYDYGGNLVRAEKAGTVCEFDYDPLGRLVHKRVTRPGGAPRETHYFHDDHRVIETRGDEEATYVYGPGLDEVISYRRAGRDYYLHQKRLWTVSHVTDAAGALVESYRYDPFGARQVFDAAGTPLGDSAVGNVIGYAGRWLEPELGLYSMRARWYDPELGRFITPDPRGWIDGLNVYRYAGNNPTTFFDPFGTSTADFLEGLKEGFLSKFLGGWLDTLSTVADIVMNAGEYVETLKTMLTALTDPEARAQSWEAIKSAVEEELSDAWSVVENAVNALGGAVTKAAGAAVGAALGFLASRLMRGGGSIAAFFASVARKVKNLLRRPRGMLPTPQRCPGGPPGCFLAGTLVLTREGERPIEEIRVNDEVLAREEGSGEVAYRRVLKTFPGRTHRVCLVRIGDDTLRCTPDHLFWRLDDESWVEAALLAPGDRLLSALHRPVQVTGIVVEDGTALTWNFEVEGFHSYFVALAGQEGGVWVHNTGCPPGSERIPLPMNERIPLQPLEPGMVPRPGYKWGGDGQLHPHGGQVTVSTENMRPPQKKSDSVRRELQERAQEKGLREADNMELHETPMFGSRKQIDVQLLPTANHRLGKGQMKVHHRKWRRGYVGGTNDVWRMLRGLPPRT